MNQRTSALAADDCEDWCKVPQEDHDDHRDRHSGIVAHIERWDSSGLERHDLFLTLTRPYVEGFPLAEIVDRHTSIRLAIGDDEPMLSVPAAVARSLRPCCALRIAPRMRAGGRVQDA